MRSAVVLASLLLAMTAESALPVSEPASSAGRALKAIRFGSLVDGAGKRTRDAVVVVEGGRIREILAGERSLPSGAELIDLRDFTGLPGLIDAHTHMTYAWDRDAGGSPWTQGRGRLPAVSVFLAQENARRCLESGVTTVRDMGSMEYSDIAMRDLIAGGKMPGPRMFVAGHGLHLYYESARTEDARPYPGVATGVAEVMRVVRQEVYGAGTDHVKMFASTGTGADLNGRQTFTYEEIRAAADAAHALGVKFAVHSYGPEAARDAVRAGADSIEHAVGLDDATLKEMATKGIVYVPTIDHNRYYADNGEMFGYGPEEVGRLREFIPRNVETARRAHAAGVRLAMGSDALFTMFGQNTRELAWFVKAGLTPAEAIATATRNAAGLLGKADELGDVAPGFHADLVAVEGDPLADIRAVTEHVIWVMKGGEVVVDKRPPATR